MQGNKQLFSWPTPDTSIDGLENSRRKKPSVTFPPIDARAEERRGSSAPAGTAAKRRTHDQHQPSILSLRRNPSSDRQATGPAALAIAPATHPAADEASLARSSPPSAELSFRATPVGTLLQPRSSGKASVLGSARPSSGPATESFAKKSSVSTRGPGRPGKDGAPPQAVALQQLVAQVELGEKQAKHLLSQGDLVGALDTLRETLRKLQETPIASRARRSTAFGGTGAATARSPSPTMSLRSGSWESSSTAATCTAQAAVWRAEVSQRLALAYTVAASTAGVRCGVTAEALPVQKAYFQVAMRYLVQSEEESLYPEWKQSSRPSSGSSTGSSRKRATGPGSGTRVVVQSQKGSSTPFYPAAGDAEPYLTTQYHLLRCSVRNNAAVCLADRSSRGGQARTIYELLKALVDARGVWAGCVLYNLAVSFLAVEHYDDAAEAIARCMELSYHYLHAAEMVQRDPLCAASEVLSAIHACMALQLIRAHHFIATMAAWCDPAGVLEVQHCEMALGCARQYLSSTDARQRECQRRLAAAQARAAGTASRPTAPQLSYLKQDYLLGGSFSGRTVFDAATGALDVIALVDGLFSLSSAAPAFPAVDLPVEVQAYVNAAQKKSLLRYWAKESQRCGAAPPFLSAAKALAPLPFVLLRTINDGAEDLSGSVPGVLPPPQKSSSSARDSTASQKSNGRAAQSSRTKAPSPTPSSVTLQDQASSSGVSPLQPTYRPSKPAPCFVTTLPQSTFHRYRNLRASVVAQMESSEGNPLIEMAAAEEDSEGDVSFSGTEATDSRSSHFAPQHKPPTGPLPPLQQSLAGVSASGRRMTVLLYGASSTSIAPVVLRTALPSTTSSYDKSDGNATDGDGVNNSGATKASALTSVLAVSVLPSELLRQLDSETEACYSRLVADPLADVYREKATRLQAWWRGQMARRERGQRSAAVALRCLQDAQALRIQCVYCAWRRRRAQAAERESVHQERYREEQVAVVQAFLNCRRSLELWGRACVRRYEHLVECWRAVKRQEAAAVTLQSWWRMCAAQTLVQRKLVAVIRLQAVWRGARVRSEQRKIRVHRRLAEEAYYQSHLSHIVRLQRWWRWCRECHTARAIAAGRQQAVSAYLSSTQAAHDDAIRVGLRSPDDAVAAMRAVLAVLAGARDRYHLGVSHAFAQIRMRAVHRYILRRRGCVELARRRRDLAETLRCEKRREEVAVATLRLQRWARRWLPRCQKRGMALPEDDRSEAAATIQAMWRRYQVRQQNTAFSRFMSRDRHQYASVIQRAWRACHTRRTAAPQQQVAMELDDTSTQPAQEQDQRQDAHPAPPPTSTSESDTASTRRFQVPQPPAILGKGLSHTSGSILPDAETEKTTQRNSGSTTADVAASLLGLPSKPLGFNHLGAVTGMAVLPTTPNSADLAVHSLSCSPLPQSLSRLTGCADKPLHLLFSDSTDEAYAANATHRPSAFSDYYDEESEEEEGEVEVEEEEAEEEAEESGEVASVASHSTKVASHTRDEEEKSEVEVSETTTQQYSTTAASSVSPTVLKTAEFPIPRPPVSQRITCSVQCRHTPEEIAAAILLQSLWRGYRARSNIEYYYEEYYEEVDEGDEEVSDAEEEDDDDAADFDQDVE